VKKQKTKKQLIRRKKMKGLKLSLMVLAATLLAFGLSGVAYAFHAGGVAECGGCHSMHAPKVGGSFLLIGTDQSSTCLSCHERAGDTAPSSYHVSSAVADMPDGKPPLQRGPAGDFGWLKKTYTFTNRGTVTTEQGYTHGHNIVAADKGYTADPVNVTAPGGTYSASQLGCQSCHNVHGKYRRLTGNVIATAGAPIYASGSTFNGTNAAANEPTATEAVGVYRLLHGGTEGGVNFPGAPVAKAPSTYNRTEASTQTRVAYGTGSAGGNTTFGSWCASCHPGMHSTGNYVHPIDQSLGSTIKGLYDAYVKSGDMTGSNANSFTSLVPFAENNQDYAGTLAPHARNNDAYLTGPGSSDKVMCLSCHRAHASGWPYSLRWNMEGTFLTIGGAYPGTDTTPSNLGDARGRTGAETAAAYYDRPVTKFATYQRVLCNKCHAKD
jgi:predicted CXXCH cytochrome family protein